MHVHFGTNAASVAMLCRVLGGASSPTYSFTVHGPDEFDQAIGHSLREKIDASVFVCAISDFGAAQLKRWAPMNQWRKVHVIRCTVGESFFSAGRAIEPESRSLVTVGRLSPQKGHLVLIEGFAQAIREGVDARLVLVGDGELRGEIERRIAAHKLEGRVELTGSLGEAQVRERILASRAMVLPSFARGSADGVHGVARAAPTGDQHVCRRHPRARRARRDRVAGARGAERSARASDRRGHAHAAGSVERDGRCRHKAVFERHNTVSEGAKLEALFASVVNDSQRR
jgi:colanic acid/amylovoran biosynthesis glycosyltransferase